MAKAWPWIAALALAPLGFVSPAWANLVPPPGSCLQAGVGDWCKVGASWQYQTTGPEGTCRESPPTWYCTQPGLGTGWGDDGCKNDGDPCALVNPVPDGSPPVFCGVCAHTHTLVCVPPSDAGAAIQVPTDDVADAAAVSAPVPEVCMRVDAATGGSTDGATGAPADAATGGSTDGATGAPADAATGGSTDGATSVLADAATGGWTDGATGAPADAATGGSTDGATSAPPDAAAGTPPPITTSVSPGDEPASASCSLGAAEAPKAFGPWLLCGCFAALVALLRRRA